MPKSRAASTVTFHDLPPDVVTSILMRAFKSRHVHTYLGEMFVLLRSIFSGDEKAFNVCAYSLTGGNVCCSKDFCVVSSRMYSLMQTSLMHVLASSYASSIVSKQLLNLKTFYSRYRPEDNELQLDATNHVSSHVLVVLYAGDRTKSVHTNADVWNSRLRVFKFKKDVLKTVGIDVGDVCEIEYHMQRGLHRLYDTYPCKLTTSRKMGVYACLMIFGCPARLLSGCSCFITESYDQPCTYLEWRYVGKKRPNSGKGFPYAKELLRNALNEFKGCKDVIRFTKAQLTHELKCDHVGGVTTHYVEDDGHFFVPCGYVKSTRFVEHTLSAFDFVRTPTLVYDVWNPWDYDVCEPS